MTPRSPRRGRWSRAPLRDTRLLAGGAGAGVRRGAAAPGPGARITLRVRVPDEVVALVRHGLAHPERAGRRFWDGVADRLADAVLARVPARAGRLALSLDEQRLEVRVAYRGASGG